MNLLQDGGHGQSETHITADANHDKSERHHPAGDIAGGDRVDGEDGGEVVGNPRCSVVRGGENELRVHGMVEGIVPNRDEPQFPRRHNENGFGDHSSTQFSAGRVVRGSSFHARDS
ncbi:unnamed protein product [Cuscuta epithymum]|uniref:Uncharacterized protein n=1 Tax=Cuscuta epithymum TaxID=186058 RepID=A0AAV0D9L2_9ASTE|nr:unnamed protein product [Cuscuta epithymum]